jgi:uncharacterized protein YyaL (SSP411 family)
MLYDNGPLLGLYADLARVTGEAWPAAVAHGIVDWLVREMRTADGAFCSSQDADSDGEEGLFYVWAADEVRALLPPGEHAVAAPHFGLDRPPNFEGRAWHLRVAVPLAEVAARLALPLPEAEARLAAAKATLLAARAQRVRPGQDDKVLTSWNALAIAGLARAARALHEPAWADLACTATDTLRRTAWRSGRLCATRKGERAHGNAYLDDYAFLLDALVELVQTRFRARDFAWALELADVLLAQFEDPAAGGFFFTSHDHERLIHRSKPGHDNATPSGNGVAAQALVALGHLAAEPRYVAAGERAVRLFAPAVEQAPGGYASLLVALEDVLAPPTWVLLTGDEATCAAWQRALETRHRPATRVLNLAGADDVPAVLVKGRTATGASAAWVCRGTQCLPPVDTLAALEALVGGGAIR